MKTKLLAIGICLTIIFIGACKYEDGPSCSLASKKSRVANLWKLEKVFNDGVEQTITALGNHTLELTKDGNAVFTVTADSTIDPITGTWAFGEGKETLEIIYSSGTNPDDVAAVYTILRLKQKELWLERAYDDGTAVYLVETHYIPAE